MMSPLWGMLAYALFLWWASTGAILFLNHLPPQSFRWSMLGFSLLCLVALYGIVSHANDVSVRGAYIAFTSGVLLWGWHEMSFFMGFVTGPRRVAGPATHGWRHFWHACQTCLYHETAIALTAGLILVLSAGGTNQVATWTFFALWIMRLSAKLNVFLGVRNLNEQFVPLRLSYLKVYLARRRMNALLPFSLIGGSIAAYLFGIDATMRHASPFQSVAHGFIAVFLALAVIEHAFMVIPMPFAALWNGFVQPKHDVITTKYTVAARGWVVGLSRPIKRR